MKTRPWLSALQGYFSNKVLEAEYDAFKDLGAVVILDARLSRLPDVIGPLLLRRK